MPQSRTADLHCLYRHDSILADLTVVLDLQQIAARRDRQSGIAVERAGAPITGAGHVRNSQGRVEPA